MHSNKKTEEYLATAMSIDKTNRQIITSEDFMAWLFSEGTKQADVWFNQILPVAQLAGYKTIFKETYLRQRAHVVREEFGLNRCQPIGNDVPALNEYADFMVPPGYKMDEAKGIARFDSQTLEYKVVFPHPVIISKRYRNIQSGEYFVSVVFYDNGISGDFITDLFTVSNSQQIQSLTKSGIRVTSESAKFLVSFLSDFLSVNIMRLEPLKSTTALGWYGKNFLPYSGDAAIEGNAYAKSILNAVKCEGDYAAWKKHILDDIGNDFVRVCLSTSFASPLLALTKKPIFVTHLWGKSGTAKSTALLLALSVWGNPLKLKCQWDATIVAAEQKAMLLNNIPMSMNESELLNEKRGSFQSHADFVYMYCEGETKPRGAKDGGNQMNGTWNSCCISNGEGSLDTGKNKGGDLNRVLEFETDEKLFQTEERAISESQFFKENYGYAGKEFTEKCLDYDLLLYWHKFFEIAKQYATGKQAGEMASLLLGDMFMQIIIYNQDVEKSFDKSVSFFHRMKHFLKTDADIDISARAYEYLLGWIAQNSGNFLRDKKYDPPQIYGTIEDGIVYIIANVFNKAMSEQGYNLRKITKDFMKRELFAKTSNVPSILKKIKGNPVRCYCFAIDEIDDQSHSDFPDEWKR